VTTITLEMGEGFRREEPLQIAIDGDAGGVQDVSWCNQLNMLMLTPAHCQSDWSKVYCREKARAALAQRAVYRCCVSLWSINIFKPPTAGVPLSRSRLETEWRSDVIFFR
jgi:hypothetical protein